ncbi:MAG TPA: hypothetical protein VL403_07150, partial [Candidatus Kryptonia bacterium]|nr:hypothetical protein [Candidatus Kryptonia bacterium]
YVYAGNLPGHVGRLEDTCCPECAATVVERVGFRVRRVRLSDGTCAECGTTIPGRWGTSAAMLRSRDYPVVIQ